MRARLGVGLVAAACGVAVVLAARGGLSGGPRSTFGFEPGEQAPDLRFEDVNGKALRLAQLSRDGLVVIAMRDAGCPVAKRYGPRIGQLEKEYAARGVQFVYVNVNAAATREAIDGEIATYGLAGPYVHDGEGTIAAALQATTTTEVFVIDRARTLVYRGAIDDQYGIGWAKPEPRTHSLRAALDAVLAGGSVVERRTDAPGCVLDVAAAAAPSPPARGITYSNRVSRIIQNNCQTCHRGGGVAPFALETYEQVSAYRAMIRYVIENGIMPPWYAKHGVGEFANERRLAGRDRADLLAWIEAGGPRGNDRDAPAPRQWAEGWNIGEPDAVVELPQTIAVPAEGVLDYKYVYVKTDFPEDRWIERMELRPTAPQVTHHVLVFIEEPGRRSARDAAPGEPVAQGGIAGYLGVYVPGAVGHAYPAGAAKLLPKGAWLKFQLHYTPNGTATADRTRVGFVFADGPPEREVHTWSAFNAEFRIPPGAPRHEVVAERRFRNAGELLALFPHMHFRGAAFRFELMHPDGRTEHLLEVPRYDFNWQLEYRLKQATRVEPGSVLRATAWFDNSAQNPANPDPTKEVRFGEQTFEEMMIGYFDWMPDGVVAGGGSR